jgi:CysZ protein
MYHKVITKAPMNNTLHAISATLRSLLLIRVWQKLVLPILFIAVLLLGLLIYFFNSGLTFIQNFTLTVLSLPLSFLAPDTLQVLSTGFSYLFIFFAFAFALYFVTFFLLSNFIIPILLPTIQIHFYPSLSKKSENGFWGSFKNSIFSLFKYILGLVLTLPLWLIPGAGFVLFSFWNAYLVAHVFSYEVLQDWTTKEELKLIRKKYFFSQIVLGLFSAFFYFIPLINLIAPALIALLFIHFNFQILIKHRTV